ncbi:MAG: hypothetical protein EBW54_03215, partial [Betaproteobacteria bacterium]|nr:hypothetical protein [Betaproteobacteria bacterium]
MYERLSRLCLEAAEDPSLKAIILTGAGDKAFAAAWDNHVNRALKPCEHMANRFSFACRDKLDRVFGKTRRAKACAHRVCN